LRFYHEEDLMKTYAAIGLVVLSFAVSLPGMYLLNNPKALKWELFESAPADETEDKDNPEVDVYCLKGLMYLSKGEHDKAITAYSAAIKLDPKYSFSYLGRGDVYLAQGDLKRALADYDTAARLDPDNDAAKERAAIVRAQQRQ
jgi:tetratricopeptide (TPR) repeat protein